MDIIVCTVALCKKRIQLFYYLIMGVYIGLSTTKGENCS